MDPTELTDREVGGLMQLRIGQHRDLGDPDASVVENWLATGTLVETDIDGDVTDELDVVQVHLVRCPLGDPTVLIRLDEVSGDLAAVGAAVLKHDGEPIDAVTELSAIGSHFLILNSVVSDSRFAGRRVGRWVAAEAIEALSSGTEFVAAIAAPMDDSKGAARAQARAKLAGVWTSIGFTAVRDDVMVMNPGLKRTHDLLEDLRQGFGVTTS